MKNGCQTNHLGELCDVLDYKRKPITKRDRVAGDYPYYGATGVLDHVEGYLFDEPLVLVGEDGAKWKSGENTAFAVEGKIWVNNHAHVLRPHRTKLLDNWLIYQLNHSDLTDFVSGLTVPKLNQGSLREIPIPLPPLPEQQRIVGILDQAFEGIATAKANTEKNILNARAIFESHRQSVLANKKWMRKTLGDVCDSVEYGSSAKSTKTGKVPVLRMGNIQDGKLDWEKLVYSDNKAEISKYLLKHNDVLFNRTNSPALVGKTAIYKSEMPAMFAGYLIRIHRKDDLLDADYLTYYLNSDMALNYGRTVTISSVNQGREIKRLPDSSSSNIGTTNHRQEAQCARDRDRTALRAVSSKTRDVGGAKEDTSEPSLQR
jgi:type I restriction enzyme S subunit